MSDFVQYDAAGNVSSEPQYDSKGHLINNSGYSEYNIPSTGDIYQDYTNYFQYSRPGEIIPFGEGSIERTSQGAYLIGPDGEKTWFSGLSDPDTVALQNPWVKDVWGETYDGWEPTINGFHDHAGTYYDKLNGEFDFPTNLYPSSSAQGIDFSTSGSYSSLPTEYRDQLLAAIMPALTESLSNYNTNIDSYTTEGMGKYTALLQNALKEIVPQVVGNLGNRNIIDSTSAKETIADTSRRAVTDASTQGYGTAMLAAQMKAQLPQIMGTILGQGQSTTQDQFSFGMNNEQWSDPTQMYQYLTQIITSA